MENSHNVNSDVDYSSPIYKNVTKEVSPTWKDLTKPLELLPFLVNETVDIEDDVDYLSPYTSSSFFIVCATIIIIIIIMIVF